jgi:putative ABC transport system ATP-binding protein
MSETVIQTRGLSKAFGRGEGLVRAVDEVDLAVCTGETVAVMGPSGCGKSRCCTCSAAWSGPPPVR